ncbi:hypothetical protein M8368_24780 [Enterobacter kobei]|nr:hypothetical protein [Enterobacter kobei]
MNNVRAQPDNR